MTLLAWFLRLIISVTNRSYKVAFEESPGEQLIDLVVFEKERLVASARNVTL